MSEQFDAGLRDLYAAAEMAHDARPGLAVDVMVARTRRRRRARAAAVTMATAAAVVGVAVAGTAVARNLDAPAAPPADGPTESSEQAVETVGSRAHLTCGVPVADLRVLAAPPSVIEVELARPAYAAGEPVVLAGSPSLVPTGDGAASTLPGAGKGIAYDFVVTTGGTVVATTEQTPGADLTLRVVPCDPGVEALTPGEYDLYGAAPVLTGGVDANLVGGPWPFTLVDPAPLLPPDQHFPADGVSAVPPDDTSAPLPDGDYIALVGDVDAAAGTVTADIQVMYTGQAAEDWVSWNSPEVPALDGYVLDNPDGTAERTLRLGDAAVWEWCSTEDALTVAQRAGGVAEWAAAPTDATERWCADGAAMPRWGLYWLDVRGGVVVQVVGQFLP